MPIFEHEKEFTAFEVRGNLYQFKHIPFGVTNRVASFQCAIDKIIKSEGKVGTFADVDNVTIFGLFEEDHDNNLQTAAKYGLTFNQDKMVWEF